MAKRRITEAERLRLHNAEFRFALANNITIIDARRRLAQLSFAELEQRVHPPLRPASAALCGTQAPELSHTLRDSPADQPRYWWENL